MRMLEETGVESAPEAVMLLDALTGLRRGNPSVRLPAHWSGVHGKIADVFNDVVEQNANMASELARLRQVVGKEGKLKQRASLNGARGFWGDSIESINALIDDLVHPTSEVARVIGAVAQGDLSKSMALDIEGRPLEGEFLSTAKTINRMVEQLSDFSAEVTRVAREVGTEGKLGGQADVKGVAGTWKDLTDSVNSMAGNLTAQVRNIADVTTAVAKGDLSKKIDVDVKGEFLTLKNTINTMVDQLRSFASEVTRVAREVGTEGSLGGQAKVEGVSGTWKDLTDSVNSMAGNLTSQVRNIADVTKAVAAGDLSKKITVDVKGEISELKATINTMVDQLSSFAAEVTRVAREVGTEGRLGGQAEVRGLSGTWKDLTESVNSMAGNLTSQVRNIADVTKAVASGNLSKKITVDVKGEMLELKDTINTMVDQLRSFAAEVTRVAREVGTEGKLGGQADVKGVAGTWKDLTESVNFMAGNLTSQVRNIAEVTTAVAAGDLSKKITVQVKGEILELKNTINTMVDQLSSFAAEVTRVAREVGTEGKLGGQADVQGVAGTWKDLTESVNSMAGNLTGQVRNIADVTKAVAAGDLSKKITVDVKGEISELKDTINTMVDQLRSFAAEVTRVAREVGTEGKLGGQADVQGVAGTWKDLTESVNSMASNLTSQVRNIADVTKAVAAGDLSKKITVDVQGEILELKNTINTMVDQLRSFAAEVTRVAREVGTEGKLGGQADVQGVAGTWKDLTDNVNFMAGNLTSQVRGIAKVVTAVANGDLKQKLMVEAKGEIAALAETINSMTDTLATFADQVTTVAREVGVEGKLGGQAKVPGAAGTWKALTENVNELAANLTAQVRAIAEVATAVTKGDLTRSVTVDTQGEVAALRDTINEMIRNLKDYTEKSNEQNWLKTNLAKFNRMLQGQKDLVTVGKLILSELVPVVGAQQAEFYVMSNNVDVSQLKLVASYASGGLHTQGKEVELGEGLVGQCAIEKEKILLTEVQASNFHIVSGLSNSPAKNVLILPIVFEGQVRGVLELASLESFSTSHKDFLNQLTESIGIVINTIDANSRTEDLLTQSQSLTEELQQTNLQLQEKARLLAHQNQEVERKNREVEQARQDLEEKAEQLALTSKYKSEFLANMSHELRTPLNSLLILSDQLCRNPEGNLNSKQIEFSKTIHSSGNELLTLINDILDLSKIESGTVAVDSSEVRLEDLYLATERSFRYIAESKQVDFMMNIDQGVPKTMVTDAKRLQQIIRNLLSNAFKFTHEGHVAFSIFLPTDGWSADHEELNGCGQVIGFSVSDTGIGISPSKQQIIFEAFQQADGSTSRKYGGTGLGLAISRELSRLLGGEIRLISAPGKGSTFTLYLPQMRISTRTARPVRANPGDHQAGADALADTALQARKWSRAIVNLEAPALEAPADLALDNVVGDDRYDVNEGDRVLLIVENDLTFSRVLLETARQIGFKALTCTTAVNALLMTSQFRPAAITLDIFLPDMQGWRILDRLKADIHTSHIPICVVSTDESRERALQAGAIGFLGKPLQSKDLVEAALLDLFRFVERTERRLITIMPESNVLHDYLAALDHGVEKICCRDGAEFQENLATADAIVLDTSTTWLRPRDVMDGLEGRTSTCRLPVILYSSEGSNPPEWAELCRLPAVREARSLHDLLFHTTFFLHRSIAVMSEAERQAATQSDWEDRALEGKKALIVDDDIRNIYALSAVLGDHGINILSADNGPEAIELVESDPHIDIVLMDIMMPEMDGITTMQEIRKLPHGKALPIIAVTAKARDEDRQKCIEAGAWDYLSKPVDPTQLLAVMRGWLCP